MNEPNFGLIFFNPDYLHLWKNCGYCIWLQNGSISSLTNRFFRKMQFANVKFRHIIIEFLISFNCCDPCTFFAGIIRNTKNKYQETHHWYFNLFKTIISILFTRIMILLIHNQLFCTYALHISAFHLFWWWIVINSKLRKWMKNKELTRSH